MIASVESYLYLIININQIAKLPRRSYPKRHGLFSENQDSDSAYVDHWCNTWCPGLPTRLYCRCKLDELPVSAGVLGLGAGMGLVVEVFKTGKAEIVFTVC